MKKKEVKEKKKLTLKERLKDKREKAKLELMIYGIFFLIVIIFVRITGSMSSVTENNETAKRRKLFPCYGLQKCSHSLEKRKG